MRTSSNAEQSCRDFRAYRDAQGGESSDTIGLMSGDYGTLNLSGINQSGFITLAAAGAPTADIEGKPRGAKVDIGAYAYRGD